MNEIWQHKVKAFCKEKTTVFVACSGGMDSVALVHTLKEIQIIPTILHVNFQLRGAASDEDERWLKNLCEKWNLPFKCIKVDTKKAIAEQGGSVQLVARELRYNWFDEILATHPNSLILTAHHLNDNIEQLILSAISSGNLIDLAGIPGQREGFYRPFLDFTKAEISAYMSQNKLDWREDASNQENKYTRNKVRNQVLPLLQEVDNRSFVALKNLQNELTQLNQEVSWQIENTIKENNWKTDFAVPFSFWDNQLTIWKVLFVRKITGFSVNSDELEKLRNSKVSAQIRLNNYLIIKEKENFFFKEQVDDTFSTQIILGKQISTPLGIFLAEKSNETHILNEKNRVCIDAAKIKGELNIRTWQKGDEMIIFGLNKQKKISDLLINNKIPLHERSKQLVVCDDEKIIWLVGIRLSEKVKLETATRETIILQIFHK